MVGSGAAGLMGAITAARNDQSVLILEQLPNIATKLKATGGGRCNLTNTLDNESFMQSFGKNGRFMRDALNAMDHKKLMEFFLSIGVETHIPDGFRVFPKTHNSSTIIDALKQELQNLNVTIKTETKVINIEKNRENFSVKTTDKTYSGTNILLATGGLGYPKLGSTGEGLHIASDLGHKITRLYPAMMPLHTKETWQKNCTSETIPKVEIKINLANKKLQKLKAKGDLIFTKMGLRGPVILDFAREITPFLDELDEVPILITLTKMDENEINSYIKKHNGLYKLLPQSVLNELCKKCNVNPKTTYKELKGEGKDKLIKLLAWTPFTIIGHDGFNHAMITRGGVSLKEINPATMESKVIDGLYFAGEIVNIDGPCGGYNLQWSFSSGYLAGSQI